MRASAGPPKDRLPISTLEKAIWRLVQYYEDETVTPEAYSMARAVIADIFWVTERRVDHLVNQYRAEIFPPARPSLKAIKQEWFA